MEVWQERDETEYLQIAGIQHFVFCRRQWALIHIEQQWAENYFTIDGAIKHEKVHTQGCAEQVGKKRIIRSLRVVSHELKIQGICDAVELVEDEHGEYFSKYDATYTVYPVEYKRGKPKTIASDLLQLVAQALCLEEMLGITITEGAIFYFETRHRETVAITSELRHQVIQAVTEMNGYYQRAYTPRVRKTSKCRSCSLQDMCLPGLQKAGSAAAYLERRLGE